MCELEKDVLTPTKYKYLSQEDSGLYDSVKHSLDIISMIMKGLILDKADASKSAHGHSRY